MSGQDRNAERARRNRELMPNVASVVDEFRKTFPNLKVLYAKDHVTGHSVGSPSAPAENAWVIPDGFRAAREMVKPKRGGVV